MNAAILAVIEQHQRAFIDALVERFQIPKDQVEDTWEEIRKTKMKKVKKVKKPSVPSGYILFCREKRQTLEHAEEMSFGDISKELGRMWRSLDDKEKLVYTNESDRLRASSAVAAAAAESAMDDTASTTTEDHQQEMDVEDAAESEVAAVPMAKMEAKPEKKAPRKKKGDAITVPDDIEEQDREAWIQLFKLTFKELRTECENRNLIAAKNREACIRLVLKDQARLRAELDGRNSDDEDEDEDEDEK